MQRHNKCALKLIDNSISRINKAAGASSSAGTSSSEPVEKPPKDNVSCVIFINSSISNWYIYGIRTSLRALSTKLEY